MGKTEQTETNKKINDWLTPELKMNVKNIFEIRYKRKLSDNEVYEIANNLATYVKHVVDFIHKTHCEKQLIDKSDN
jgi:hypothetical protein